MRFAQISDPHFGTTTPAKIAALTSTLKELALDFVAVSGDLTQRARREQFLAARDFFAGLAPLPVMAVPGNHDIPLYNFFARLFYPYWGFRRTLKRPTHFRKQISETEIIGLDSTHPTRIVQGDFRWREYRMLKRHISGAGFRIAMFHHPLDTPKYVDAKNILRGADGAVRALAEARVDLVLGGHIHDPLVVTTEDRYPGLARPFVISVAGTCLSSRTRADAPNSFHVFDWDKSIQELRVRRFDLKNEAFTCVGESTFRRDSGGWRLGHLASPALERGRSETPSEG